MSWIENNQRLNVDFEMIVILIFLSVACNSQDSRSDRAGFSALQMWLKLAAERSLRKMACTAEWGKSIAERWWWLDKDWRCHYEVQRFNEEIKSLCTASIIYWARNKCLQNVISTTQAGLGRQISLATSVTNISKPVTKINFGPSSS